MIFREIIAGKKPNINSERLVVEHCQLVLNVLKDEDKCKRMFIKASEIFEETRKYWINNLKKSRFAIKDNKEFTDLLLTKIRQVSTVTTDLVSDENYRYKGEILRLFKDRYGTYCGFISRRPNDIFFHSSSAKGINLFEKVGHLVSYKVSTNPKNGQLLAVDLDLDLN
jgi:hypothetical protein